MLDLEMCRQLGRSFGHVVYKTLSLARYNTERPVRQLEPSRLAVVVQYCDAAKFSTPGTFKVRLPDLNRIALAIEHSHAILVFQMCEWPDGLVIGIKRGRKAPYDLTRVHVGDVQSAGLRRGDKEPPLEVGFKAPNRVVADLQDGFPSNRLRVGPVARQQSLALAHILP